MDSLLLIAEGQPSLRSPASAERQRFRKGPDVVDRQIVAPQDVQRYWTEWQSATHTCLWFTFLHLEITYERAKASSNVLLASCLAIGASRCHDHDVAAKLVKDAQSDARKLLCPFDMEAAAARVKFDLYGCLLLSSFFEISLVGPIVQMARGLGLHHTMSALTSSQTCGYANEAQLVFNLRLYSITWVYDFTMSLFSGCTPMSPTEGLSASSAFLLKSRFAQTPGDHVLQLLVDTFIVLAAAQRQLDPANRVGPVDPDRLCDFALRFADEADAAWDKGTQQLQPIATECGYQATAFTLLHVFKRSAKVLILSYACLPGGDVRNIASHTKRAQVAAIAVAAAHECVDQFVASGAANITDAASSRLCLVQLGSTIRFLTTISTALPGYVDIPAIATSLANLTVVCSGYRFPESFKAELSGLHEEFLANVEHIPAVSQAQNFTEPITPSYSVEMARSLLLDPTTFALFPETMDPVISVGTHGHAVSTPIYPFAQTS